MRPEPLLRVCANRCEPTALRTCSLVRYSRAVWCTDMARSTCSLVRKPLYSSYSEPVVGVPRLWKSSEGCLPKDSELPFTWGPAASIPPAKTLPMTGRLRRQNPRPQPLRVASSFPRSRCKTFPNSRSGTFNSFRSKNCRHNTSFCSSNSGWKTCGSPSGRAVPRRANVRRTASLNIVSSSSNFPSKKSTS